MTTGKKISLIYSAITLLLVTMSGLVCYAVFSRYTEKVYFRYIEEKAHIVATERFERDELPPEKFRHVVEMRKNAIPTSREVSVNIADTAGATRQLRQWMGEKQMQRLFEGKDVDFHHGRGEVGTAFIYRDNEGTFAVVVLSRNPYIASVNRIMGLLLALMFVSSALILWLVSRLYAVRTVERINEAYSRERMFVSNASHEINNPLTAVQGECEIALLRPQRSAEEYRKALEVIQKETARMAGIMKQLLMFSHTRYGDCRRRDDEVAALDKISMAEFMGRFADENTAIHVDSDFSVWAKEDMLAIAMRNLVDNARKYSGGKQVEVLVDGSRRRISVCDHGAGIAPQDLKHIFEPFFRGVGTERIPGHGIGLSLAREIFRHYGFAMAVESSPAVGGTTVVVEAKTKGSHRLSRWLPWRAL